MSLHRSGCGSYGAAPASLGVAFVSQAAIDNGLDKRVQLRRKLSGVRNARPITKANFLHNQSSPRVQVDPSTLEVDIDGKRVETWPSSGSALSRAVPIYEDFEGWEQPIHDVRSLGDLPENARRYVTALEEHAGVPIVLVSVGPERTQTIERAWRPMRHRPTMPA